MPSKQQNNVVRLSRTQQRTANRAVAGMKGKRKKLVEAHGGGLVELELHVWERKGDKRKDGTHAPPAYYWNFDPKNRTRLRERPGHPDYIADLQRLRTKCGLDPNSGKPTGKAPEIASIPAPQGLEGTIGQLIYLALAKIDKQVAKGDLQEVTAKGYRKPLNAIDRDFGGVGLADFTQAFVQQAVDLYEDSPRQAKTIRLAWQQIATAGMRAGVLETNIAKGVEVPTYRAQHFLPWNLEALEFILANAPQAMADVIRLRAYSGLRQMDAMSLTHFSLREGGVAGGQSKTRSPFFVPWYNPLEPIVRDIASRQPDTAKPLLLKADGKPWTNDAWRLAFSRLRKKIEAKAASEGQEELAAKIKACQAHGLRSTAACFLMIALEDEAKVAAITGHQNIAQVRTYTAPIITEIKAKAAGRALKSAQKAIPVL